MVTVVIPFFNRSNTIKRAVDSVLNQTFSAWECIVVNDGSNAQERDELIRIVNECGDPRIQLEHMKENRGGGAARNRGIDMAQGQFIAFLDSDDEWLPGKLLTQVAFAKAHPRHVISCQSQVHHAHGQGVLPQKLVTNESVSDYLFVSNGWIQTSSLLILRTDLAAVRFDESLPRHQDYDLLFQLEKNGITPRIVPEVLVQVHWEDVVASGRSNNVENSRRFLSSRNTQFSRTAASCFRAKFIAQNLLKRGHFGRGTLEILKAGPRFVRNKQLAAETMSIFLFRDDRILRWISKTFN